MKSQKEGNRICVVLLTVLTVATLVLNTGCAEKKDAYQVTGAPSVDPVAIDVVRVHAYDKQGRISEYKGNFRNQLVDDEVIIYDAMVRHFLADKRTDDLSVKLKQGYISIYHLREAFDVAWFAFSNDHPEVFWVYGINDLTCKKIWITDFFIPDGEVVVSFDEFYTGAIDDIKTVNKGIEDAVSEIASKRKSESRYDTVRAIYDFICSHAKYDHDAFYNDKPDVDMFEASTAAPVFGGGHRGKMIICEGYARVLKILCAEFDIPCVKVENSSHSWNYVQMEDEIWYVADACWDDVGEYAVPSRYSYFLLGKKASPISEGEIHKAYGGIYIDLEKMYTTMPVLVYPELGDYDYCR